MASSSSLSADTIGLHFTEVYYKILHEDPDSLHRFYQNPKELKILKLGYGESMAEITDVVSEESCEGGILIAVTGSLLNDISLPKRFKQTFFLARQEMGKYVVLNDIFQLFDNVESPNLKQNKEVTRKLDEEKCHLDCQVGKEVHVKGFCEEDEYEIIDEKGSFLEKQVAERDRKIAYIEEQLSLRDMEIALLQDKLSHRILGMKNTLTTILTQIDEAMHRLQDAFRHLNDNIESIEQDQLQNEQLPIVL